MELISVQKLRQEMVSKGLVPTVIFSCKRGQASAERQIDGKGQGIFTQYLNAALEKDPIITFREAIRQVNITIQGEGFEQQGEVICRIDVLDMPINDVNLCDKIHVLVIFDMCRTMS